MWRDIGDEQTVKAKVSGAVEILRLAGLESRRGEGQGCEGGESKSEHCAASTWETDEFEW